MSDAMALIEIVEGDITREETDAIVNAANSALLGGGGVDGAIHREGGPAILDACKRLRIDTHPAGLPVGHAVATPAGRLRARWVIHTVGPVYRSVAESSEDLAACHTACLAVADRIGAKSIAFPAIATGAYGYPLDEAARVALHAVRAASTSVERVRFVLLGRDAYDIYANESAAQERDARRRRSARQGTPM
jgi:O-acetyl-ADP-ribose deacetylase (regulator of RNase III)